MMYRNLADNSISLTSYRSQGHSMAAEPLAGCNLATPILYHPNPSFLLGRGGVFDPFLGGAEGQAAAANRSRRKET